MRVAILAAGIFAALFAGVSEPAVARIDATGHPTAHAVYCSAPGTWPRTRDAAWLWNRIRAAGYRDIGCTGSAFVVDYGGIGMWGHDLYISAFTSPAPSSESRRYRVIAGVRVYGRAVRLAWRAGRRNVWLASGPTSYRLPPRFVLERLVRATTSP